MPSQLRLMLFGLTLLALLFSVAWLTLAPGDGRRGGMGDDEPSVSSTAAPDAEPSPRWTTFGRLTLWWDPMPASVVNTSVPTGPHSNIRPDDYAGADSCRKCHKKNHASWMEHAHRSMNALATAETVVGDFSGEREIQYLGGTGRFVRTDDGWQMHLSRDGIELTYDVHQTIGSRFFQYYVGTLGSGPFHADHPYRTVDHVLPFGYWIDRGEWVPVVHISGEFPDGERADPFNRPMQPDFGFGFVPYSLMCNLCHTTFPMGDSFIRKPQLVGEKAPYPLHFDFSNYVRDVHSELLDDQLNDADLSNEQVHLVGREMAILEAPQHAATLGISCEACHLGCAAHVERRESKPSFLPQSDLVRLEVDGGDAQRGRTPLNANWTCSRCHAGQRPQLAAGMSTWNSTEFSDAIRGSCYSQLTCIHCHDPHEGIGPQWTKSPAEDDASCTQCHQQYESPESIAAHTHHPIGSSGARCVNCHMPRLNEGLQNVVRTHTIFSPTEPRMIESNHPNACNICHTDQPIDWTVKHLQEWYGATFDPERIRKSYPDRDGPVARGWLTSENEAVRLIATDAVARSRDEALFLDLASVLDDPYLLNRQFTRIALESMFDIELSEFGYRFYMTPEERRQPVERIREAVAGGDLRVLDDGQSTVEP